MKKENIKFKAKRIDNGEWIIGSFVVMKIPALSKTTIGIVAEGGATLYEVALSTVCQFTGYVDKNGKEIYEGDVLRSDNYPYSCIEDNERDNYYAVVYYCEEGAFFGMVTAVNPDSKVCGISDGIFDDVQKEKMKNFEVVGNIHEPDWKQYGKYFQEIEEEASND